MVMHSQFNCRLAGLMRQEIVEKVFRLGCLCAGGCLSERDMIFWNLSRVRSLVFVVFVRGWIKRAVFVHMPLSSEFESHLLCCTCDRLTACCERHCYSKTSDTFLFP
jgi:hypothetical protein